MAKPAVLLFCAELDQDLANFASTLFESGFEIWANASLCHFLQAQGTASHRVVPYEHMPGVETPDTPTNREVLARGEIPFFELVYAPLLTEEIEEIQDSKTVEEIRQAQKNISVMSYTLLLKAIEGGRIVVSCPGQFEEVLAFLRMSGLSETERMRFLLGFALVAVEAIHDQMAGFAEAIEFQIGRLAKKTGVISPAVNGNPKVPGGV